MVTASIVVHKTPPDQLKKALECLSVSSVDKIYVIDNSPGKELKEYIDNFNNTEYNHVKNNGFGAAHNIAIRKSIKEGAKYHLVMNADVCWEGDVVRRMVDFLNENKDTGLISPKTYYPNGTLQYTCRMLPTPADMFLRAFLPELLRKNRMKRYLLQDFCHNKPINCPYLLGSFMLFRTEVFNEIGLFDERFFMYPEDIDITRRIHEKWKTIYWPEVKIIHEHQQASKKSLKMFWIHFSNMVKYFNKWGWIFDSKRRRYNKVLLNDF